MGRHWVRQRKKTCNTVLIIMSKAQSDPRALRGGRIWHRRFRPAADRCRGGPSNGAVWPIAVWLWVSRWILTGLARCRPWARTRVGGAQVLRTCSRVVSGGGDRMSEVNGSNECIDHGLFQTNASMFITDAGRGAALPDQQIPAAMLSAEAGD